MATLCPQAQAPQHVRAVPPDRRRLEHGAHLPGRLLAYRCFSFYEARVKGMFSSENMPFSGGLPLPCRTAFSLRLLSCGSLSPLANGPQGHRFPLSTHNAFWAANAR